MDRVVLLIIVVTYSTAIIDPSRGRSICRAKQPASNLIDAEDAMLLLLFTSAGGREAGLS